MLASPPSHRTARSCSKARVLLVGSRTLAALAHCWRPAFVAVTPVQQAVAEFLAAEPEYPQTLGAFYQAKRDLFIDALASSRFAITPSGGTYFQLLDYSAITDTPDHELCEQWTREIGIASIPISVFSATPPEQHYLRFCFAKSDEVLLQAAEILCKI